MKTLRFFALTIATLFIALAANAQSKMTVKLKNGSEIAIFVSEIEQMSWAEDETSGGENDPGEQSVTGDAYNITNTTATLTCYANNILDNLSTDLKVGVIYTSSGTPNKNNGVQKTISTSSIGEDGKYTVELSGLTAATTYYYRSYVYQSGIWFYGKVKNFTTTGGVSFSATTSNITCFSTKVSAKMNTSESVDYKSLTYGICYGKEPEPTNKQAASNVDASGQYSTILRALEGNTIYYYRPYAVMDGTTFYGTVSSFKTLEDNVVETGTIDDSNNVKSKLLIGGGAYSSLQLGLCWSTTNTLPTIEDANTTVNEVDDENCYTIQMGELYGTIYYRAYLLIDGVAHYGDVKSGTSEYKCQAGEAVDLGLSVKWANCNVGATSPEDYGDYFAWGETTPKSVYDWSTYFDTKDGGSTFDVYNNNGGATTLKPEDDAATVNWGAEWRMPTIDELNELRTNCTWTWTTQNGINGYKVTGTNGNSIFLPASGYRLDSSFYDVGSFGRYWSSSLSSLGAHLLNFGWGDVSWSSTYRFCGQGVRAVCP